MPANLKIYLDGLYSLYRSNAVIIDTETTGFAKYDEVIDFAAIYFNPNAGTVLADYKFYPKKQISPFATKKHGYTAFILKSLGAVDFFKHATEINSILINNRPMAYNAAFDMRLLKQTFQQRDLFMCEKPWHCAMKFYEYVYKEKSKLEAACIKFNITAGQHTALSDCIATRDLLIRILNDHNYRI
jgi:DNA polymerase-3 subunit epsilon